LVIGIEDSGMSADLNLPVFVCVNLLVNVRCVWSHWRIYYHSCVVCSGMPSLYPNWTTSSCSWITRSNDRFHLFNRIVSC